MDYDRYSKDYVIEMLVREQECNAELRVKMKVVGEMLQAEAQRMREGRSSASAAMLETYASALGKEPL